MVSVIWTYRAEFDKRGNEEYPDRVDEHQAIERDGEFPRRNRNRHVKKRFEQHEVRDAEKAGKVAEKVHLQVVHAG